MQSRSSSAAGVAEPQRGGLPPASLWVEETIGQIGSTPKPVNMRDVDPESRTMPVDGRKKRLLVGCLALDSPG